MAIQDDISIASNGDIRYTGASHGTAGAGYYTVIELHRFLGDLADDASASGDDLLDITFDTPSDRSTDNIIQILGNYNIDDVLSEHLYDGSIIQNGGDDIYDGIVNFGNRGIHINIIQNGAKIANDFWNTVVSGEADEGLNWDAGAGISHRFLIKVRSGGADIDGRRLLGTNREFGYTYGEFPINGTSRGNNVLALSHGTDLNNATAVGTVAGWTSVTNIEGYREIDVNNDGSVEPYYSEWNLGTRTINQFYERTKYLTRRDSGETVYGLTGELFRGITHEFAIDGGAGTFDAVEPISWTGGTAQMLAIDSAIGGTKMWVQLLTGVLPTDNQTITGGTSGATVLMNGSATEKGLSFPFVGASTGSAIIGSYGLGIEGTDLTASDKVTDLGGILRVPPNYVTFTVGGLVVGEDRVLITPENLGAIEDNQFTLNGAITSGAGTVVVNGAIPSDTPSVGTIRVYNGSTFSRVTYTGWNGSSFTGCAGTPTASDGANVYITYLDKLATSTSETFTGVYSSDRSLYIRVRDGDATPIKTFETTGTLGSAGGSTTVIRTSDE